ncbi:ArsR/SmtB family transcription factor [Naumannella halotolerans]|uniref:Helix-turn-helix protein n=1 Tax=Naumannella halotolerans TaxID=993414 RepID=A0A4R7IZG5_9ACTN|nr:helix-turn-helix protein [Naumannella halotolerans]
MFQPDPDSQPDPNRRRLESVKIDRLFLSLGNSTRRRVLGHIAAKTSSVSEVARALELSDQVASYHLRYLQGAGLVERSSRGSAVFYVIRHDTFAWLRHYVSTLNPETPDAKNGRTR